MNVITDFFFPLAAASVMLEQGLRAEDPETQKNCFAVCLNTLLLVAPEYAWIVKPTCTAHQVVRRSNYTQNIIIRY